MEEDSRPRKCVVIFGANGGIGNNAAEEMAGIINLTGEPYDVHLVTRRKEGRSERMGIGLANKIIESYAVRAPQHELADVARSFGHGDHPLYSEDHMETLKPLLEKADMILVAAGEPRKKGIAQRSALIGPNSEAVRPITRAIALYAPLATTVITCTNPLDNIVTLMERECREEWRAMGVEAKAPLIKIIGMAGGLDESRLRVFIADAVNQALKQHHIAERIRPLEVEGHVYGQHGPAMVIDPRSIIIHPTPEQKARGAEPKPLLQFLFDHDKKREHDFNHGLEQEHDSIIAAAQNATLGAGKAAADDTGATSQTAPGDLMAQLAHARLSSDEPVELTASVVHPFHHHDEEVVASGRPIRVSRHGVELGEWPEHFTGKHDESLRHPVYESYDAIAQDQRKHDLIESLKRCSRIEQVGHETHLHLDMPYHMAPDMVDMINAHFQPVSDPVILRGQKTKVVAVLGKNCREQLKLHAEAAGRPVTTPQRGIG